MRNEAVRVAVAAALVACGLACAGSALAGAPALRLESGLSAIAADGKRVAVAVRSTRTSCDGILVWTPSTGRQQRIDASTSCPGTDAVREGIRELALAGRRIAWIEEANGNLQDLTLRVRRLDRRSTIDLAFAENHDGAEGLPDGSYVGYLRGDGDVLAYNTWTVCTLVPADYEWDGPRCEARGGSEPTEIAGGQRLWMLRARRTLFGAGPASFALAALDHGRVATAYRREIRVYGSDGGELGTVTLGEGRLQGAGLSGGLVVVVRASRLETYSIATGELVATHAIPPGSRLMDVDGDLAAVASRLAVTVVRLTDGAARTFRLAGARVVGADLERAGLFHAWSLRPGGRVRFVARAELVQAAARLQSP
jgi:hypothetical protein